MRIENLFHRSLLAEWLAVVSSLCFTFFLAEGYRWSWFFGGLASVIYVFLVFRRKLFAETALHLFYFGAAILGWINWGETANLSIAEPIPLHQHLIWIASGVFLTLSLGWILNRFSMAHNPYLDSFTTVFSILATVLMVQYVRANWLYWIVIDLASIYLYGQRKMFPSVVLYLAYTLLAINAYLSWGTVES
jgi:nicotinamide mononucleotide transporter